MMTFADIEKQYLKNLDNLYPIEEARTLFRIALEKVTALSFAAYSSSRNEMASPSIVTKMFDILEKLVTGQPIQQIIEEAYFYGAVFHVSRDTLIPRSETEELVHLILTDYQHVSGLDIIDIGTGTGCIALTLARKMQQARIWAMDVSHEALTIAKTNAEKQQQDVRFILGDILEWEVIFDQQQQFDIIVSNPPYITPKEKSAMHSNVLDFEPADALFVTEEAPLLFYDHIADFALVHLKANGCLYFEINQYLGQETVDLLKKKGFRQVTLYKDMSGADRMIAARRLS